MHTNKHSQCLIEEEVKDEVRDRVLAAEKRAQDAIYQINKGQKEIENAMIEWDLAKTLIQFTENQKNENTKRPKNSKEQPVNELEESKKVNLDEEETKEQQGQDVEKFYDPRSLKKEALIKSTKN